MNYGLIGKADQAVRFNFRQQIDVYIPVLGAFKKRYENHGPVPAGNRWVGTPIAVTTAPAATVARPGRRCVSCGMKITNGPPCGC